MQRNEPRSHGFIGLMLLLIALTCVCVPGCSGCWQDDAVTAKKKEDDEAEKKKKKKKVEKPKPNFEMPVASVLPNDPNIQRLQDVETGETKEKLLQISRVKPGHWAAVSQVARANNFDFVGEVHTSAINADGQPLDIEHTNFRVACERPASLPKGQTRALETFFYLPRRSAAFSSYTLRTDLFDIDGNTKQMEVPMGGSIMREHEFFFVVLASNPSAYTYVDRLESVSLGVSSFTDNMALSGGRFYDVSLPRVDRRAPLPTHPLAWTMIAYIVWDDVDPAILTQEQQQALVDWLHWGGQLVVSGPNTLDKLKGSFLAPYLPAEAAATVKFDQAAVEELNETWSLVSQNKESKTPTSRRLRIAETAPLLGVELKLHPTAAYVPQTGKLVAERRIGGGRVVVTAFAMTDLRVVKWKGFDNFFNACLLRRPGREFGSSNLGDLQMRWANVDFKMLSNDPRLVSTLRYFTRDIGYLAADSAVELQALAAQTSEVTQFNQPPMVNESYLDKMTDVGEESSSYYQLHPDVEDWHFNGYHAAPQSGVAGWNDFSAAAEASRQALREAAGIKIPRADFVLKVLAVYLLVLVPLNWLVFWLIGRVEWAWLAAPLIALVGAIGVIRLAQLDIGFARSRTEIAVLELQGDHPRGHLTRYMALYTSLATRYKLTFDDANALALPFSDDPRYERPITKAPTDAVLVRDETIALDNMQVPSNSTVLVHSEQMLPLAGGISLAGDAAKGWQAFNRTSFTIYEAGVLRKTADGLLEAAFIGELRPQSAAPLRFSLVKTEQPWTPEWDKSFIMSEKVARSAEDKGRVRLFRLVQLAAQRLRLNPGDVRLIAWTDDALPGLQVTPEAPQTSAYTLVIAHLVRGGLPAPESDKNIAEDYKDNIDPEIPGEAFAPEAATSGAAPAATSASLAGGD